MYVNMDTSEGLYLFECGSLVWCFAAFANHQTHRERKQNSMVSLNKFNMLFSLYRAFFRGLKKEK